MTDDIRPRPHTPLGKVERGGLDQSFFAPRTDHLMRLITGAILEGRQGRGVAGAS
jgi:hypothetical protein